MQEKLEKFSPVNVMRLHILCEFFLRQQIKFNHCICQRLRVGSQIGYEPEHSPSKSSINLFQRYFTRIININDLKIQKKLGCIKCSFIKVWLNISDESEPSWLEP